jgi:putative sigma-54 modulation protein
MEVPSAVKDYALKKLARLEKFLNGQIHLTEVEFSGTNNPSVAASKTVEVTLHTKGTLFRAKESSFNMQASIDLVVDKLEKQIKKFKDKHYASLYTHKTREKPTQKQALAEPQPTVVKVKKLALKPMSVTEAAEQMELLGHTFFIFNNEATEAINVLYKRADNNYGLIELY